MFRSNKFLVHTHTRCGLTTSTEVELSLWFLNLLIFRLPVHLYRTPTTDAHIMLDFDVLHVPCGHNNAHGFYIEEDGQTSLPVCGRRRTYRKYYSTSNKLTLTFYAPEEVRFLVFFGVDDGGGAGVAGRLEGELKLSSLWYIQNKPMYPLEVG